ncbi:MAG: YwaF family protein [Firmicutes bacterium]|nr:YwaF family protein [Lachnospiraceae bacterium]MDD6066601.1 YwaF family protein [Bacillota bacterium]MDY2819906.1 YwaF family protein [Hominisplanchenecus sp.]
MKNFSICTFSFQRRNRLFLLTGSLLAASEICKQLYLTFRINHGSYLWWNFPFQLCSIAMYILLVLPWVKNRKIRGILLQFLMCYSMLGGIAAFADTSGMHYPVLWLTIHSYLWHIILIFTGIFSAMVYKREVYPGGNHSFFFATCLYLLCCIAAEWINAAVNPIGVINLFYINPHYQMTQVFFGSLVPYIGNRSAICVYISATTAGAGILHILWNLLSHRRIMYAR